VTDPFAPQPNGPDFTKPGSEPAPPPGYDQPPGAPPAYGQPPTAGQPTPYGQDYPPPGSPGEIRSTGLGIFLYIITFGIYGWYYFYKTHDEMKRHTGTGLGGGIALVLAIVIGIVNPFLLSDEVGKLYTRRGQQPPVTGITGLWVFPGCFIIVGPFIWFAKTNGALNDYWRSVGVQG
jgi:hypothetical protein